MKYILTLVMLVSVVQRSSSMDFQSTKLKLDLENLIDGIPFYLIKENSEKGIDTIEVAKSSNGSVIFISQLPMTGERVFIYVAQAEIGPPADKPNWISIFLESPAIHIKGNMMDWPVLEIEGAKATAAYENYFNKENAPRAKKLNELLRKMRGQSPDSSHEFKEIMAEYRSASLNYFKKNLDVISAPLMVVQSYPLSLEDKKQLLGEMKEEIRESLYGQLLKNKISDLELEVSLKDEAASVRIDEPLPDFSMEMPDGDTVSIKELAAKNEYTLIDFWAYWCVPCVASVPDLKKAYEKYHDKGFNIIGISIDPNRAKWLKMLDQLDTKWDNLLDVKKISKPIFSISAIPAYILINKNAEIVAMSVFGNKQNGASSKYFKANKDVYLNGETIDKVMEELLEKR